MELTKTATVKDKHPNMAPVPKARYNPEYDLSRNTDNQNAKYLTLQYLN